MKLPFEILSIVMKVHQKYFSLVDNSKKMAPYFLVVSNLKPNNQTDKNVVKGNERVLRADYLMRFSSGSMIVKMIFPIISINLKQ